MSNQYIAEHFPRIARRCQIIRLSLAAMPSNVTALISSYAIDMRGLFYFIRSIPTYDEPLGNARGKLSWSEGSKQWTITYYSCTSGKNGVVFRVCPNEHPFLERFLVSGVVSYEDVWEFIHGERPSKLINMLHVGASDEEDVDIEEWVRSLLMPRLMWRCIAHECAMVAEARGCECISRKRKSRIMC
jgi:hypothetical protein